MKQVLNLRIILLAPTPGVDFAVQYGKGNDYDTRFKQRSGNGDLLFEFPVEVRITADLVDFGGPNVHGPRNERFIYIDIGRSAGQFDSIWQRRLKVPLKDISVTLVNEVMNNTASVLEIIVPGVAKDGGPNCATVKPFPGWHITVIPG
jgi:hypothetical protein